MGADAHAELESLRKENAALRQALLKASPLSPSGKDEEANAKGAAQQFNPPVRSPSKTIPAEPLKLSEETLEELEKGGRVEVPKYPRQKQVVEKWIMHLGLGGFSRSHLAMLSDEVFSIREDELEIQEIEGADASPGSQLPRWGICGVGLMPWDVKLRDALKSQDYLYTLITRDSVTGDSAKAIGSIMDYMHIPDDPKASLERLSEPSTAIVSLTVTEKGYCLDSAGNLDLGNENVQHDLSPQGLEAPKTALGVIVAALRLRRDRGIKPFTVLSCDNLPMNGGLARRMVLAMAGRVDAGLAAWIGAQVDFPSSMVDRITPVTTQAEMDLLRDEFGVLDAWPVVAEPYVQWVVEDFKDRPAWELCGGVQFVEDVKPYELMKLRLLNSSHSALAYVGYLAGHRYVHDAMGDPLVRSFMSRYMASVAPTVPPVPGVDLLEYQATLIRRFSNEKVADTLMRLAQDGSAKWGSTLALGGLAHSALGAMQFAGSDMGLNPPLFTKYVRNANDLQKIQQWRRDHRRWRKMESKGAHGEFGADISLMEAPRQAEPPPQDIALALAAWVRYMTGYDESGEDIKLSDPMAAALQALAKQATKGSVTALEDFLRSALGESSASWPELTSSVSRWLTAIKTRGMACALAEALAESSSHVSSMNAQNQGGGADLAALGSATAHGRLAVLKLKHARLEAEMKEVIVHLALAQVEAEAEEEQMAKLLQAGLRRPRPSSTMQLQRMNSPEDLSKMRDIANSGTDLAGMRVTSSEELSRLRGFSSSCGNELYGMGTGMATPTPTGAPLKRQYS